MRTGSSGGGGRRGRYRPEGMYEVVVKLAIVCVCVCVSVFVRGFVFVAVSKD